MDFMIINCTTRRLIHQHKEYNPVCGAEYYSKYYTSINFVWLYIAAPNIQYSITNIKSIYWYYGL